MSEEGREALRRRLAACLPSLDADCLVFGQDPQLLCGIELRTATEVIRWTLADDLAALEHGLADALSAEPGEAVVGAGG